jgi:hypothetical protein
MACRWLCPPNSSFDGRDAGKNRVSYFEPVTNPAAKEKPPLKAASYSYPRVIMLVRTGPNGEKLKVTESPGRPRYSRGCRGVLSR